MEECKKVIDKLLNDDIMRDEYRKKAKQVYSYYDSSYVFNDMFNFIK